MKTKLLFAALLCTTNAYAGCGSSFCSVNTHWDTQGLVNDEGLRIDLRYSYAKADTPRVGSKKVAKPLATDPALLGAEVENLRTINETLNLDMDYAVNEKWNIALDLPLVMRDHAHQIGDPALTIVEQRKFTQLGDIRVIGNYKLGSGEHHSGSGVRFGLKLPTGQTNLEMAPGKQMEAGLQPGSGSTDAVLGAYYHQDLADSPWGWFVSGQLQTAVALKNDYRPGDDVALDFGTHYAVSGSLTALLQLNAHYKKADSGTAPNMNPHTGGKSLNLSPGLSYAVAPKTKLYGFVQLPIYQYANPDPAGKPYGQLTAPWSLSVGLSRSF
ncbi:MAG TPA: hypothetical protein VFW53_05510 [Gallionella sp.]|nr:hypothetical protein [Gallionella sp.]